MQGLKLKAMNTFFQHKNYGSWWNHLTKKNHMLDIWSTNTPKIFRDCKIWKNHGIVNSDHIAIVASISLASIKNSQGDQLFTGEIDWKEIRENPEKNKEFN